jgi:hypothetical protein
MRNQITDKVTTAVLTAVAFISAQVTPAKLKSEHGSNDTSNFGWVYIAVIVVGVAVAFFTGKAQEWMGKIDDMGWW